MKIIITGANGTIGQVLKAQLKKLGHTVVAWDRTLVPIDNYQAMEDFVSREQPGAFFHLAIASQPTGRENEQWMVNYEWPSEIAWICRKLNIPLVYTSTAMVFSDQQQGPFTVESEPNNLEGYGYVKRQSERRVFYQYPQARIVRLGWQIGDKPGSNNMIDFFDKKMREEGQVSCSSKWLPACSFLEDTSQALIRVLDLAPGLYMADSNRGWNFFEIATALRKKYKTDWKIVENQDFVYDQRLIDPRLEMPPLSDRLPGLNTL